MVISMPATPVGANGTDPRGLTGDEVRQFHEQGFLGPVRAFSAEEMARVRTELDSVLATPAPDHDDPAHNRHLDQPVVRQLATAPAIIDRIRSILGPNLVLWRTNFFAKHPGAKEIPWHQDANFWPIEPAIVVSAWIAIDRATKENGCVQLIPGTHRAIVPHVEAGDEMQFEQQADPKHVDTSRLVDVELEPGEFFLFNERTLHHSEPNRSDQRRIGMAIRVVPTITRMLAYDSPNHGAVVVSGADDMGFNRPARR